MLYVICFLILYIHNIPVDGQFWMRYCTTNADMWSLNPPESGPAPFRWISAWNWWISHQFCCHVEGIWWFYDEILRLEIQSMSQNPNWLSFQLSLAYSNLDPCASQRLVIVLATLYTLFLLIPHTPLSRFFFLSIPSLRHNPTQADDPYLSRSSFTNSCWSQTLLQYWESRAMVS